MNFFTAYSERLNGALRNADIDAISGLAKDLAECWGQRRRVFLCGNGGSAGNAIHLANDFIYGVSKQFGQGIDAVALSANAAVITCLANDLGYDKIFSCQLGVQARQGDLLIALSGSGNSENILSALEMARQIGMKTYAILGYSGGKAKSLADVAIHFPVDDMQIAEDLQLVIGHMTMQWLYAHPPARK